MYFMVKSCIHTVRWPELHKNMPYLSPHHCPVPNSGKFRENIEIQQKWANSAVGSKFRIPQKTVVPSNPTNQSVVSYFAVFPPSGEFLECSRAV